MEIQHAHATYNCCYKILHGLNLPDASIWRENEKKTATPFAAIHRSRIWPEGPGMGRSRPLACLLPGPAGQASASELCSEPGWASGRTTAREKGMSHP
eukprot:scaffold192794_cov24-Prasinocladus_malaysianus.AAC.1